MENKKKRVIVASIGTFLEWAEFTYFAYIANTIAALFFPELGSRLGLIATFSVFAVGYFFRPLGSLYFGYLGDKLGRRVALQASIMLMGISSSKLYWADKSCMHIIQALHWLKDIINNDNSSDRERIKSKLVTILAKSEQKEILLSELRQGLQTLPAWMNLFLDEIISNIRNLEHEINSARVNTD